MTEMKFARLGICLFCFIQQPYITESTVHFLFQSLLTEKSESVKNQTGQAS